MIGSRQLLFYSAVIYTILITLADVVHTDTVGELKAQIADLENRLQRLTESVVSARVVNDSDTSDSDSQFRFN